jgi:hypothetical protein
MTELKILPPDPPGKQALTNIRLKLEIEHAQVAIILPHTHVIRANDPDVLDHLAARITAAAATLRRYREQGEVPMLGGGFDHAGNWWQD